MRYRVAFLLLFAVLGGCAGVDGKKFVVSFQPFSPDLDPQAQATVRAAAAFARAHELMPLSLTGYAFRPDTGDINTLRQQRVAVVQNALVGEGVSQLRIEILGNGLLYPDGVPNLPADQVVINIGL